MINDINYFFLTIQIAIIGYVYGDILVSPGHILSKWKSWLDWTINRKDKSGEYVTWLHWFYDPLVGCVICITGEMMLWTGVIIHFYPGFLIFIDYMFYLMLSMFVANILNKIMK